jgi:5'-AMP-activated protein kinase catalytic alpha subunit
LDHNNDVKLVDFGLGNLYKEGSMLKTACGSPCYAAPEMVSGLKYYGLNTDIWSGGVVLYAMVAGFLPFEDKNTAKLYKKI